MSDEFLHSFVGFDWDAGNVEKNWTSHKVAPHECEEIFYNQPLIVATDPKHSQHEKRYFALGRTDRDRNLFVAFTLRKGKVRVISARDMSRKERRIYGT